jgi:uncharacterized membrane protein (DUF373 family)
MSAIFWDIMLIALVIGGLSVVYYLLRTYWEFRKRLK